MLGHPDMRDVRNVIFDFDGVIADTEPGRMAALRKVLRDNGYGDVELRGKDFLGVPSSTILRRAVPGIAEEEVRRIIAERRRLLFSSPEEYIRVYDLARETVLDLAERGYVVLLATVNDAGVIASLLSAVGLAGAFAAVYSRERIYDEDRNVKRLEVILDDLRLDPGQTLIVEDSCFGIRSARRSGIFCICLNACQEACEAAPDVHVRDYAELRRFFGLPAR